jgi:phosphotransacetylase
VPLFGFDQLYDQADAGERPVAVAVAGGHDRTVLEALRVAEGRGWVAPILVGPGVEIADRAQECGVSLDRFEVVDAPAEEAASRAVGLITQGRARMLMKGQIATPALMHAVLDPAEGLRSGRVICQVVLMEIVRDQRRFLLADTGICVHPKLTTRIDILKSLIEVAKRLGADRPRVALMAASESVNMAMPETIEAAELRHRNEAGEFADSLIQGPLSFDLAYAADAGEKKRIEGAVVGAADAMLFPNLLSANLTVKAIMYTADCRFGGVLRGTSVPVVFMSRADVPQTRLNSLALALALLDRDGFHSRSDSDPNPVL